MKKELFKSYKIQISKIIDKSEIMRSTKNQLIALANFKDIIEIFNWKIKKGKDL